MQWLLSPLVALIGSVAGTIAGILIATRVLAALMTGTWPNPHYGPSEIELFRALLVTPCACTAGSRS